MLHTFAVANYRSLRDLKVGLRPLTVVTGANGSGKSNLYRALRLLQHAAEGHLAEVLAREGGVPSVAFAGPSSVREQARRNPSVEGTIRTGPVRISVGFAAEDVAYEVHLGLPPSGDGRAEATRFYLDPVVKAEHVWQGPPRRRANAWLERDGGHVMLRDRDGAWVPLAYAPSPSRSLLADLGEPERFPEVVALRERIRGWRFYDGFRTDEESPLRHPRVSVRTDALASDGRDLAAALQTILEVGDAAGLADAVADAFPGSSLEILEEGPARLEVGLRVQGLLRTLRAAELSDGTLRYLALLAALESPRPPELLVLNEPEQSLHPDLLAPLARRIVAASERSQVWVISHASALVAAIDSAGSVPALELVREHGETRIRGQGLLDEPRWP